MVHVPMTDAERYGEPDLPVLEPDVAAEFLRTGRMIAVMPGAEVDADWLEALRERREPDPEDLKVGRVIVVWCPPGLYGHTTEGAEIVIPKPRGNGAHYIWLVLDESDLEEPKPKPGRRR